MRREAPNNLVGSAIKSSTYELGPKQIFDLV
jgi:hypothetical protein